MKSNNSSKLMTVYSYLSSAVTLSLLWWIACIPIVTIGASTAALYNSAMILTERDAKPFRLFKESFKKFFKPATVCWCIFLVIGILIGVDYIFFMNVVPNALGIVKVISIILAVTWAFIVLYLFPVITTFSGTNFELVFNALILSFMHAPMTILMFAVYFLGAYGGGKVLYALSTLLLMYSGLSSQLSSAQGFVAFASTFLFFLLLLPGAAALINGLIFKKVFKEYVSPEYVRYNSLCKK